MFSRFYILTTAFILFMSLFFSCRKFTGSDIPRATFLRNNPQEVSLSEEDAVQNFQGEDKALDLEYSFEDGDGNVSSATLTKIIQNVSLPANIVRHVDLSVSLPEIPKQRRMKGTLRFLLSYFEIGGPQSTVPDTVRFALQLTDAAGNKSDTAFSPNIIILRSGQTRQ